MTEDAHLIDGRATQVTSALWTFLTAISSVKDELERARLTATSLPSLLPCQLSGLAILNEVEGTWHVALQRNGCQVESSLADELLADVVPLSEEAFRRPRPLSITAEGGGGDMALPATIERLGVRYLAVTPLRTLESRFGTIFVGRASSPGLSRLEESILLTLASHLSTGIENIRLYGTLQHHAENLEGLVEERTDKLRQAEERRRVLLEINNAIIAHLDKGPMFAALAQALRRALTFDGVGLTLYDPASDMLHVYALAGAFPPANAVPVGREFARQGSHLEEVLSRQRPVVRRDLTHHRIGLEDELFKDGIRSTLAVPLMGKEAPLGALAVGSRTPDQYSDADAEFLADVGQQVALAVDNMLAYEEIAALKSRLEQENLYLLEEIETQHNFGEIVGKSPAIKHVLNAIETVAATDANVVIMGETGTGKELVARAVHNLSSRNTTTLIKVNCASIPKDLFESEFFGHVRGAFTGALRDRAGRFELAHRGTLFLDEVGEIPLDMQSKLLRVLQEGEIERVGEERTRKVDVRIVAATNRDLKQEIEAGRFRQDLYYRLNVFPIEIPALRSRTEDIPLLAADFLRRAARKLNRPNPVLTKAGLQQLIDYHWPGNVRELQNTIERAMITSKGGPLRFDIAAQPGTPSAVPAQDERRDGETAPAGTDVIPETEWRHREKENVLAALRRTDWQISGPHGAAALLGLNPATLTSRIKKMGLKRGQ